MKITQTHFKVYKKEFIKWVDFWGLTDMIYDFHLEPLEFSYSQVEYLHTAKRCAVFLNNEIPDDEFNGKTINEFMKILAFHECAECLLSGIRTIASERNFDPNELDREAHSIINRLQNAVQFNNDILHGKD